MSNFSSAPVDVVLLIFRWAMKSASDFANFSLVNSVWKKAARKRQLWEPHCRAAWPSFVAQLKAKPDRDWYSLFRNRRMAEQKIQAGMGREFTPLPIEASSVLSSFFFLTVTRQLKRVVSGLFGAR